MLLRRAQSTTAAVPGSPCRLYAGHPAAPTPSGLGDLGAAGRLAFPEEEQGRRLSHERPSSPCRVQKHAVQSEAVSCCSQLSASLGSCSRGCCFPGVVCPARGPLPHCTSWPGQERWTVRISGFMRNSTSQKATEPRESLETAAGGPSEVLRSRPEGRGRAGQARGRVGGPPGQHVLGILRGSGGRAETRNLEEKMWTYKEWSSNAGHPYLKHFATNIIMRFPTV